MLHLTRTSEAEDDARRQPRLPAQLSRELLIAAYRVAYEAALDGGDVFAAATLRMRLKTLEGTRP